MSDMKKFVISEIDSTIKRQIAKKKIKESSKNLYDAVSASSLLMTENVSDKKKKLSELAIALAEKNLKEDYDELDSVDGCDCGEGEGEMLKAQLLSIMSNAKKLYHMIDEEDQFEDWIQSKITIAEDYLRAAHGYLTYFNGAEDVEDEFEDDDEWDDVDEEDMDMDDGYDEDMEESILYNEALDPNIDDSKFESEEMDEAEEKWISGAIKKPGQLHKDLGIPAGEKIPIEKLKDAAKRGGKIGQRARMALNLRKINK